ncbi:MAG TPA: acetylornithine/succinylornithine family transaminase [Verrucomicrobiae bacterium]|jgi:acetylornithine aminotransferase/acetylornithine/N-succinyldiaminopimelate aminotransferase|nr:acetylornithine/succinylornithine family transaminase [Verrucomicrobiae bacterium]
MRTIVPAPAAEVRNELQTVRELFEKNVIPTYARFDLALARGEGSSVWDMHGKRYLDFGGGIAVSGLGHAHPEVTQTLIEQSQRLVHVSNLYYHEPQGRLAQRLVSLIGPGKMFFCNSGGEANEGLFKLARKFGHDEGRFEILTAENSFHGRTLAAIAATGQPKVKKGFEPMVPGFRHIPYNDLAAARAALSPATAAILIEGVQGEGGVTAATPEYLLGLRKLCDEKNLLLLMDSVQCGYFRTGRFQSFQRILENTPGADARGFLPDGISMAKALGNGFPIGAFWVRQPHADLLGAGSHGTTYGGSPLACAVALKVLEIAERDRLADNARQVGAFLQERLQRVANKYPKVVREVRGLGLMLGLELAEGIQEFAASDKSAAVQFINRLHAAGLLAIPAGARVIRILPALNLREAEAAEGADIIEATAGRLAA